MNNESLIRQLREKGGLRSPELEAAFKVVDRRFFVPKKLQDEAYGDYPLPIGYDATISQPTTVAFLLEKLDVREGQKVLDIGSGSGWTTALLAHLVGPKGKVIGLEIIPELVEQGHANLRQCYSDVLENIRITLPEIRRAKEGVVGLPEEAPFDRILVSAAAEEVPTELIAQLAPDGGLVIPVGKQFEMQKIVCIHKKPDDSLDTKEYPGFVFVPLV